MYVMYACLLSATNQYVLCVPAILAILAVVPQANDNSLGLAV